MHILIFSIIVLICAALLVWAVEKLPIQQPFSQIIQALILLVAVLVIANEAGIV